MQRFIVSFCVLFFMAANASAASLYQQTDTPAWVETVSLNDRWTSDTPQLAGQAIHYKLVDQQYRLDADDQYQRYRHYVEAPLSQDGLQTSGAIEIFFKPDYQQVTIHNVTIIRDGVRSDRLSSARISVVDVEPESDNNLYTGQAKLLIIVADYRLGDVLDYDYSVEGRNPVFGDKLSTSFSLGWSVPVEKAYRSLIVPANRKLQFQTHVLDIEPTIVKFGDSIQYKIELSETPELFEADGTPGFSNKFPYIQFTEYQSWQEVTGWAKPLFDLGDNQKHPTWLQWQAEINKQPTPELKVTTALQLVQNNIRYVGIEMGENSHRPHSPHETLVNAYGDCKDKSLLLVSLLTSVGIVAEPFLVNTESTSALTSWLPSPFAFNHVITRVNMNGVYEYIDPTLSYQAGDEFSDLGYYDYGVGLPVYRYDGLVDMPKQKNSSPHISVTQRFQGYDYALPVMLTSTSIYKVDQADYQRYRFANNSLAELERNYVDYYTRIYGPTRVAERLSIADDKDDNVVTVTISLFISDFYQYDEGDESYEYDVDAYAIDEYLEVADQIMRDTPFWIAPPMNIEQTVMIMHPTFYNPLGLSPVKKTIDNDYFYYSVSSQDFSEQTRYQFNYVNKRSHVEANAMTQYTQAVRDARDHLSYYGWFSGDDAPQVNTASRQYFKQLIDQSFSAQGQ